MESVFDSLLLLASEIMSALQIGYKLVIEYCTKPLLTFVEELDPHNLTLLYNIIDTFNLGDYTLLDMMLGVGVPIAMLFAVVKWVVDIVN